MYRDFGRLIPIFSNYRPILFHIDQYMSVSPIVIRLPILRFKALIRANNLVGCQIDAHICNILLVKVHDENSLSRQKRAALLPKESKTDFLSLLGDTDNAKYPIYMAGMMENCELES